MSGNQAADFAVKAAYAGADNCLAQRLRTLFKQPRFFAPAKVHKGISDGF